MSSQANPIFDYCQIISVYRQIIQLLNYSRDKIFHYNIAQYENDI